MEASSLEHHTLPDGEKVTIRPVRPSDEPQLRQFFSMINARDLHRRFFSVRKPSYASKLLEAARGGAQIILANANAKDEILGIGELHPLVDLSSAEFAVIVRSDAQHQGIGWVLMNSLLAIARKKGFEVISGQVLRENSSMVQMCEELGFHSRPLEKANHVLEVRLPL